MKGKFWSVLFILAAVALFAMPQTAQAQDRYAAQTLLSAGAQPASTVTNRNLVMDVRRQPSVAVQFEVMNDATGAATLRFPYQRSVDGVNWNGTLFDLGISFNGVTKQTVVTNIATYGAGYIRFPWTTNAAETINTTNLTIKYGINSKAPSQP